MTRAEIRDWRVRAMGGETVPHEGSVTRVCALPGCGLSIENKIVSARFCCQSHRTQFWQRPTTRKNVRRSPQNRCGGCFEYGHNRATCAQTKKEEGNRK